MPTDATAWYCVHTYPKSEQSVVRHLRFQGFETYLPTVTKVGKRDASQVPLFPRYVFVAFNYFRKQWRPICSTYGVKRLFSYDPETPIQVPDRDIEEIRRQVDLANASTPHKLSPMTVGCRVKVLRGPFSSFVGIVQLSSEQRVIVLLSLMHSQIRTTFSRDNVEEIVAVA